MVVTRTTYHRPLLLPPSELSLQRNLQDEHRSQSLQQLCIKKLKRSINSHNVLELMQVGAEC